MMLECGKVPAEIWTIEILGIKDLAHYWIHEGPDLLQARRPKIPWTYRPKHVEVVHRARGTVGLITPWNFPLIIPLRTIFPALLAGNHVLFKPSELTPETGRLIAEAAHEALGSDALTLITGGAEGGRDVIARSDAIVFTGSESTGRKVAQACAERLIPCALELGGKDAAIVLEDAPFERTVAGILWGSLANMGQNCASIERIYAMPSIAHRLFDALVKRMSELRPGTDLGRMQHAALAEQVRDQMISAELQGAIVRQHPHANTDPRWAAPTVLAGVRDEMDVMRHETFGPLIPITEVHHIEEAVEAINAHRYGLSASIWSKNLSRAESIARQLDVGAVTINNHALTPAIPSLPWSGYRGSGYGAINGPESLEILTKPFVLWVDSPRPKREMWWFPYKPFLGRLSRLLTLWTRRDIGFLRKLMLAQRIFRRHRELR